MYTLMVVIFILGYVMIAFEHPLKIDKAAPALLIAVLGWTAYVFGAEEILSNNSSFLEYLSNNPDGDYSHFIVHELSHHLTHHAEIIFFLMGAMTIVELVDAHEGFAVITDRIKTKSKVKLLWIICLLTFFFSAALDNLTTSIVMISLLRKLVADKKERWFFAGLVIIAANAGGAWSPIGDVTTTMLWIGTQITASNVITELFVPSLICILIPLIYLSFTSKGEVERPEFSQENEHLLNKTTPFERNLIFFLGVGLLLFVPVFKTVTHLPPYMGMMFGLGVLWVVTEVIHRAKNQEIKSELSVIGVLRKIDIVSVLFFLGILIAISSLQSAGHLTSLAKILEENVGNIYAVNIIIGLLSAVVDNVPLVAASMGMYPIVSPELLSTFSAESANYYQHFVQDGNFWEFLAYCAGTGGSALIIGSAAGVAVMGMERIDFIWYLKRMSLFAIAGYLAGAAYYIMVVS
jgi:Na+/H+ antiporter NhaD/arsenite permease-like protein